MDADTNDLPTAFWSTDGASMQAISNVRSPEEEMREWAPTFNALGWSVESAMHELGNKQSAFLSKVIRTVEDAYTHILAASERGMNPTDGIYIPIGAVDGQAVTTDPPLRPATAIKAQQVEQARMAWKLAVAAKNEAIRQWNDYVKNLHAEFVRIRDS
jgi:hypothetical protein